MSAIITTNKVRDPRLDLVKAVAVVAVVLGHVIRGLLSAGMVSTGSVLWVVSERILYMVHLPLFVFASGILMSGAVERRGSSLYLRNRIVQLLWPFLIWTFIQGGFEVLLSRFRNGTTTWLDVLQVWKPIGHLWFLPFLLIVTVVVVAIRPWASTYRAWLGIVVGLGISTLGWGYNGTTALTGGMGLFVFLVFGSMIGLTRIRNWCDGQSTVKLVLLGMTLTALTLALALLTPATVPSSDQPWTPPSAFDVLGFAAATAGVAGVVLVSFGLGSIPWRGWNLMSYLGRHSMEIYLAHILVTAGVRIGLNLIGVTSVLVHVSVGTVAGVILPLLLVPVSRTFPWLFTPPQVLLKAEASTRKGA